MLKLGTVGNTPWSRLSLQRDRMKLHLRRTELAADQIDQSNPGTLFSSSGNYCLSLSKDLIRVLCMSTVRCTCVHAFSVFSSRLRTVGLATVQHSICSREPTSSAWGPESNVTVVQTTCDVLRMNLSHIYLGYPPPEYFGDLLSFAFG